MDNLTCSDHVTDWNHSENDDSVNEEDKSFIMSDPLALAKVLWVVYVLVPSIWNVTNVFSNVMNYI